MSDKEKATEQGKGVSPISGTAPPKETQFGQPNGNPRHNGSWKKEDTPRFKLEQMMKLSADELKVVAEDKSTPLFEKKLAIAIKDGQWREIREMIEQVYGRAPQSMDVTTNGKDLPIPILGGVRENGLPDNESND